jgi:hypothetical protein
VRGSEELGERSSSESFLMKGQILIFRENISNECF